MIDLRSDTVTRPSPAMRQVMANAKVGDDVFGDDPTVSELESLGAEMLGKEAALFAPSATQSNLIALMTHCGRGDEYIVGQEAHTYLYEGGGGATLGGIQPQPLLQEEDGTLDLDQVVARIKPDDFHYARTRLLCLENTTYGKVLPQEYLTAAGDIAREHRLSTHLDGARIFNAAIASDSSAGEIAAPFDSVQICLSKGLGAPVGSLLTGSADFIREGKRWRKMLGGGMRQSGVLAAAGIHALQHHVDDLSTDHANARALADGLALIDGIEVEPVQTNMVFVHVPEIEKVSEHLRSHGILTAGYSEGAMRLVTHRDVQAADIGIVIATFADALG